MELTFIPIAAILLLLTGFNAPSRLASGLQPAGSSLRLWLNRERSERASSRAERGRRDHAHPIGDQTRELYTQWIQQGMTSLVLRRFARPLLHTRCGIASCVYRSAAPPSVALAHS